LNALVGAPGAPSVPNENSESLSTVNTMSNVNAISGTHNTNGAEESFDTLDTFLRELQADLVEASQPTSTTASSINCCKRQRYNIAAANPLLAGNKYIYI
jgi:E74-like factor 1/2/4